MSKLQARVRFVPPAASAAYAVPYKAERIILDVHREGGDDDGEVSEG